MKKVLRLLFRICLVLLFLGGTALVGGIIYLREKPLPIDFLVQRMVRGLQETYPGIAVETTKIHLIWHGMHPSVEAADLRVLQDGREIFTAGQVQMALSLRSFWQQRAIPTRLSVRLPRIVVSPEMAASSAEEEDFMRRLQALPGLEELDTITLEEGRVEFDAAGLVYAFPTAEIDLEDGTVQVVFEGNLEAEAATAPMRFEAQIQENETHFKTTLESASQGVVAALLQSVHMPPLPPEWHYQGRVDLAVQGQTGGATRGEAQVTANGPGTLTAPLFEGPIQVRSAALQAVFGLGEGAGDALWTGEITLSDFTLEQGARFEGTLKLKGGAQESRAVVHLEGRDIPTQHLPAWWPKGLGADARTWVLENIPTAFVPKAVMDATIVVRQTEEQYQFDIESLGGTIEIEDATVRYLEGQPPIQHVFGTAVFSPQAFNIEVVKGQLSDAKLSKGKVLLGALDKPRSTAMIEATVEGPAASILHALSLEPFNYSAGEGLQGKTVKGKAAGKIQVRFPLTSDVKLKDVALTADGQFQKIAATWRLDGINLSLRDGDFKIHVTHQGFKGSGHVIVQDTPLALTFDTLFGKTAPYRTRYQAKGLINAAHSKLFGMTLAPYVTGLVDLRVSAEETQNADVVADIHLGLTPTSLMVPQLKWLKRPGAPGHAVISFVKTPKSWGMPSFYLEMGDEMLAGRLMPAPSGVRVELDRFMLGGHDLMGTMSLVKPSAAQDWEVKTLQLKGTKLNAEPFLEDDAAGERPWTGSVDLDVLHTYLLKGEVVHNLKGKWKHEKKDTTYLNMGFDWAPGRSGQNHNTLMIQSFGGKKVLKAKIHDVGRLLKGLGWFDTLQGGEATVQAITPNVAGAPLSGHAKITDFRLVGTPVLTRLLSALSVEGLVNLLRGEGIGFEEANLTFDKYPNKTILKKGRMVSTALGISAQGTLTKKPANIHFKGRIVPAYAINSTIGNLPVIGTFLSGGRGNDGVFAATFEVQGPPQNPEVSVNPLSILTPGIIKKIFEGDDDEALIV